MKPPFTHPGILIEHCGSTYTCNPPPTDTDVDFLCYGDGLTLHMFEDLLWDDNWKVDAEYDKSNFTSYKKIIDGVKYNYIVTSNEAWFVGFIKARELCAKLNLMDKKQRIAVHEAFLEDLETE